MRQFLSALALLSLIAAATMIAGCGSGVRTVQTQPSAATPKGSFPYAIQNNPNIPPAAKRAMLGNRAGTAPATH